MARRSKNRILKEDRIHGNLDRLKSSGDARGSSPRPRHACRRAPRVFRDTGTGTRYRPRSALAEVVRFRPDPRGEPEARLRRLAIDPRPPRQARLPLPMDRGILLEAERQG